MAREPEKTAEVVMDRGTFGVNREQLRKGQRVTLPLMMARDFVWRGRAHWPTKEDEAAHTPKGPITTDNLPSADKARK